MEIFSEERTHIHRRGIRSVSHSFTFDVPAGQVYHKTIITRINSSGTATVSLEPVIGTAGTALSVKVNCYTNSTLRYRIQIFSMTSESFRLKSIMEGISDAKCGAYLKEVGGEVLINVRGDEKFEPASSIKILHHFHAFREVRNLVASLTYELISVPTGSWCRNREDNSPILRLTLQETLRRMMQHSDNECTEAIRRRFGKYHMMQTALSLGMNSTLLVHSLGCGWSEEMGGHNWTTLEDLSKIYEKIADGSEFNSPLTGIIINLMSNTVYPEWYTVMDEEAAILNMPLSALNDFKSRISLFNKGGDYTSEGYSAEFPGQTVKFHYHTIAGVVSIPFKNGGAVLNKKYIYGNFVSSELPEVNNNAQRASTARYQGTLEIARAEFRKAMLTYL